MKREILILLAGSILISSCGIFRNTSKIKNKESIEVETVIDVTEDIHTITTDNSKVYSREIISGVSTSPETKVMYKGLPKMGEVVSVVDSNNILELKMWFDSAGTLLTEATKTKELIQVQNAGVRETFTNNKITTTTDGRKSVKTSENASVETSSSDVKKEGQNMLRLLPFFIVLLLVIVLYLYVRRR